MLKKKKPKMHKRQRILILFGTVIITGLLYAFWGIGLDRKQESITKAADCTPTALLVNPCRPWVGAEAGGYSMASGGSNSQLTFFNKRLNDASVLSNPSKSVTINKKIDVAHVYHAQGTNLFSSGAQAVLNNSAYRYVFVNWKPLPGGYKWKDAGGSNATVNTYIRNGAKATKALGSKKIFLAVWHEPENDVSSGNCASNASGASMGSPAEYRAMWANVRNIFNQEGVSNVVWAINFMGFKKWDCLVHMLWPGNDKVDWIMYDQYGHGGILFDESVSRFYKVLEGNNGNNPAHAYTSKAWGLGEHGYGDAVGNSTEAGSVNYWKEGKTAIDTNRYHRIKMWLVWDTKKGDYTAQVGYQLNGSTVHTAEQQAYNDFASAILAKENSSTPGPTPDTTPPAVSITAPGNGSTVSGTITITANASDNVGVTRVRLLANDSITIKDDVDGSDGWTSRWSTTKVGNGAHTLKAVAYDAAGNTRTATSGIVVNNAGSTAPAPVINSFTANPSTVTVGNRTTLSWSTSNTAGCSVTPGGPTNTTATSWQTLNLTNTGTTTYTLTCKNSAGTSVSANRQVTVQAAQNPPTNVALAASSTSIKTGGTVTLSWTSAGATSCELDPGNHRASGNTGSKAITNLTATTTYRVVCSNNAGNTASNSVKVTVTANPTPQPPQIATFTAKPPSVGTGGRSTLSWSASNVVADGCSLSPGPLTSVSANSSWLTPALDRSMAYTLTCKNGAGQTTSKSVSVRVAETPIPTAPPPASADEIDGTSSETVTATGGQQVVNAQSAESVTEGELVTLEPSTITDADKVRAITRVEFYSGSKLVYTASKEPFALQSSILDPGTYTITQRTYFEDGSTSEKSQILTIDARKTSSAADAVEKVGTWIAISVLVLLAGALLIRRFVIPRILARRYAKAPSSADPDINGIVVGGGGNKPEDKQHTAK